MSHIAKQSGLFARRTQGGFSLIELMVAIAISVFLLGGLVTVLQNIRNTSQMQTQLAGLQDGERLAMTMMAGVVESAGYFPNAAVNTAAATMPIGGGSQFAAPGTPVIIGTSNFNAQGDSLTVRYAAALNDNVFNCQGGTNTAVGPYDSWENTFWVDPNYNLVCSLWTGSTLATVPQVLVSGVQSMTVLYGVQTTGGGNGTCTDTYMTAAQVTAAAAWANVCSAVVTLTFFDPTFPGPFGPASPVVPAFTRVIALMQTAGA
jgi:type IV pilus assembly protein PilW